MDEPKTTPAMNTARMLSMPSSRPTPRTVRASARLTVRIEVLSVSCRRLIHFSPNAAAAPEISPRSTPPSTSPRTTWMSQCSTGAAWAGWSSVTGTMTMSRASPSCAPLSALMLWRSRPGTRRFARRPLTMLSARTGSVGVTAAPMVRATRSGMGSRVSVRGGVIRARVGLTVLWHGRSRWRMDDPLAGPAQTHRAAQPAGRREHRQEPCHWASGLRGRGCP